MNDFVDKHAINELVGKELIHLNKVELNWRAYYYKFAAIHGGYPVVVNGRQLFRDGWQYSTTDYAGPEYPPPEDPEELRRLQQLYWKTRYAQVEELYLFLRRHYRAIEQWRQVKSAPLQQQVVRREDGLDSVSIKELDWKELEMKLETVRLQLQECERELEKVDGTKVAER